MQIRDGNRTCGSNIDVEGIRNVSSPVGYWSLVSDGSLHEISEHGHHCQAPVLDLLQLQLLQLRRVLGETERVESAPGVHALLRLGGGAQPLDSSHQRELDQSQSREVKRSLLTKPSDAISINGSERRINPAAKSQKLHRQHSSDRQHAPARVHELSLLEPSQVGGVGSESERVEPEVAGEGAIQVRWSLSSGKPRSLRFRFGSISEVHDVIQANC
mmetsp:Transcript_17074/g.23558  ORF Transcript_17074/g.23558 Transcript_17074/m.23558 type:complete len:216 (-) Transcript_17074:262-909(-)